MGRRPKAPRRDASELYGHSFRRAGQADVGLISGVTQISAGAQHTCAVANGAAFCWGAGGSGRLETGNDSETTTPRQVSGLSSGVTQISAGREPTCAVVNGGVMCWGNGSVGELGNGTIGSSSNTPVPVSDL